MNSYSKARPTARSSLLPRQSGAKEGPEPQSSRRRAKPGSFAFDVLSMTQAELQSAVVEMFSQLGLVRKDTRDGRGRKPPRGDPHASIKSFAGENGGDGGLSDTPSGLMLGRASNGPDADSSAPRTGPKGVASLLSSNETKSSPRAVRSDLQRGDGSGRRVRMTEPDSFQEPVAGGMGVVRESVLVSLCGDAGREEEAARAYGQKEGAGDSPGHLAQMVGG